MFSSYIDEYNDIYACHLHMYVYDFMYYYDKTGTYWHQH